MYGSHLKLMSWLKLKALKIHTVLLTWDVSDNESTSTAKLLKDEACTHIEINKLISENKELLRSLCRAV